MIKGPKRTQRLTSDLKRNPKAPHVRGWINYRKKKLRPKAVLPVDALKTGRLTYKKFMLLMKHYRERAKQDLRKKSSAALTASKSSAEFITRPPLGERITGARQALDKTRLLLDATNEKPWNSYKLATEIIKDFGRTKGLNAFGFGVGYGELSFFLKHFMRAKVRGVDLIDFSKELTREKSLGVMYGKKVEDKSLKKQGKFDVTYSSWVFEKIVLDKPQALAMLDNMAVMTRKGGRSYHILKYKEGAQVSKKEVTARGFRIDEWKPFRNQLFIKLTKL